MKASYKDSMQNVVFGESEKTKIRRVILDATVPVKQRSNILHWNGQVQILTGKLFMKLTAGKVL